MLVLRVGPIVHPLYIPETYPLRAEPSEEGGLPFVRLITDGVETRGGWC